MHDFNRWLLNLLYPARCCLCGEVVAWREHLCDTCRREAPFVLPPVCDFCGRSSDKCNCRSKSRAYERCVMPFYYEGVGRKAAGILKNQGEVSTVNGLALEMAELVRREYGGISFDYVTAVPLHADSLRQRGFNQSELLAKALSSCIRVPFCPLLTKIYRTPSQKEQTLMRREANLLGAFDVIGDHPLRGKTILLVDDLHTTGSTLHECAKMLQIYGAERVYAVTALASILKKEKNDV